MMMSISVGVGPVIYAKGRPGVFLKWSILYFLTNIIAVLIGISYGITGVAIAITINSFLIIPLVVSQINAIVKLKWKEYGNSLYPILAASVVMAVFLLISNSFTKGTLVQLLLSIVMGIGIYI